MNDLFRNSIIVICLCCSSILTFGQVLLTGKVINASTNAPIPFANIAFINTHIGTISDENGLFSLESNHPGQLNISHIGYASMTIDIQETEGERYLEILLEPTAFLMEEIEVVEQRGKKQLSKEETPSIVDFLVKEDGIITINYLNTFANRRLSHLSPTGEENFFITLPDDKSINQIHKTCNGGIYLLSSTHVYRVEQLDSSFILPDTLGLRDFEAFVIPCKGRVDNTLYYLTELNNGLTNILSAYDPIRDRQKKLLVIEDRAVIENYLRDYNLLETDHLNAMLTNNPQENKHIRNLQSEAHFYKNIFYKLKYPNFVFATDRAIFLFDHLNNKILTYRDWVLKEETAIKYISEHKWTKRLYKDEETGNIYGLFKNDGQYQVRIINPLDGRSYFDRKVDCEVGQLDTIQIYGRKIFYLSNVGYKQVLFQESLN